jgi:DNA-binding response OmpR family regulator
MLFDAALQQGIEFSPRSGKVLLVDENPHDLDLYRTLLEGQGFKVLACSSFESALQCLDAEPFDFVLVSQGSRAFEGRIVLERAMHQNRHRAALVVTHCIDMACYLEAMQLGAVDYLEKPIAPTELLRFVQAHIQNGNYKSLAGAA